MGRELNWRGPDASAPIPPIEHAWIDTEMSELALFARNETNEDGENDPQGPETRAALTMLRDYCLLPCQTLVNAFRTKRKKKVTGS